MRKILLPILMLAVFCISCKKQIDYHVTIQQPLPPVSAPAELLFSEFKFLEKYNSQQLLKDINCRIYDESIVGVMTYVSNKRSLAASFKIADAKVYVDTVEQISNVTINDFTKPVTYTIVGSDGSKKDITVTVYSFTGLPTLFIETAGPIVSKDDYVAGNLVVDANSRFPQPVKEIKMRMKGRGNTTWGFPKKPYKMKFDSNVEMLGMPAAKDWVLLANFADKTLMRNYLAFEMANRFNVSFTPRNRFVEVFLNGEFQGNYLLTEQIEVGANRVNIKSMSKNDNGTSSITGGYLMEVDERLDETVWFRTKMNVPITVKEPEKITNDQLKYLKNYMQTTEDVLFSDGFADADTGYAKYIDVNSFINWYLVNEVMKNNDAVFHSSVYMYKDRNGKLHLGPVWDFDIAAGNVNYNGNNHPEGWWVKQASWMTRLFQDPVFASKVKARWNALRQNAIPALYPFINETSTYLKYSQRENFKKWDVLYNQTWPNAVVLGTYDNEVQYLKDWLTKRINWMDKQFVDSK
jgi:spore coat protein CotH